MKIVQEKVDKENYLELCLTKKEFDLALDYMIISTKCEINGIDTNIGVKLNLENEGNNNVF